MNEDASNRISPMQNDPDDVDEQLEEEDDFNDTPNVSTDHPDEQLTAGVGNAAAPAVMPADDAVVAQQVLSVEDDREVTSGHPGEHETVYQSIEDNLPSGDQRTTGYADVDPELEQQAQRISHKPINHDVIMEDVPDDQEDTTVPAAIGMQAYATPTTDRPVHDDFDMHDSSTLFIPEHGSPSHSPTFIRPPPRLDTVPLRRTATPASQPEPSAKLSVFAKVRNMQKIAQKRKNAFKQAAAYQPNADLDDEAYLEAVTSEIRPLAGASHFEIDEDEAAHRRAMIEFQKQKRYYERIKEEHNGHLPFRQDVEWTKIKGVEDARLKKRQRDLVVAQVGDEQDVFPQVRTQHEQRQDESDFGFYGEASSRKRNRGDQPSKSSNSTSMQAAELQSMYVAIDADVDKSKRRKKAATSTGQDHDPRSSAKVKASKSKAKGPSRVKAGGKSSAKMPRKTAKDKRAIENATKQAASLFNADVFEQQAGMDAADQPVLKTRKKADALKELIASVPLQGKSQARSDMNILLQASKDFDGRGACKIAGNGNWLVRGMRTSLKGYQVLGSAFMRRRENDAQEPRGGLMADQMGLGKTLMMLANIVNSRDVMIRLKESGPKTTLLVASPSLLIQWGTEIEQHTDCNLKVMRYSAGNRLDSTHALQVLQSHDIVLTTYGEVMKSYPKNNPPIECQTAEEKMAWWKEIYNSRRGILHQIRFKRIVLDEAQAIKNHQSRTSIACRALMASHKWALSGTPILNGLDELYPYFKFLNVPHTGSFKIFKQNYCGGGSGESAERLLVRLSQFMIRRTHADRMFNAPILKLPQANQITYWCEFFPVERSIYNIVHHRFANNINMLSKKGTLAKSYNNVLTMLLRLRQLTAHVLMLQVVMKELLEREDIEKIKTVVKEQAATSNTKQGQLIIALRKQLEAHEVLEKEKSAAKATRKLVAQDAARTSGNYIEPSEDEGEDDVGPAPLEVPRDEEVDGEEMGPHRAAERNKSGRAFGKTYNFKPYVDSLVRGDGWKEKKEKAKCGECGTQDPVKPWLTACGHLICESCYEEAVAEAAEEGKHHTTCKTCGSTFAACTPCHEDEDDDAGPGRGTRNRAAQRRKKEQERAYNEEIAEDWLSLGGEGVLPSAKTLAIKAQVMNWVKENPSVKVIIYTQFLAMVRILAKLCQQEAWGFEEYHGKMSLKARDKAIKKFADNPDSTVLLASLRCGGLGLNLTMASKVIIIDPWWNSASEQQAFCRVFRIGQQDETFMTRMCVRNTVDERLIEMQKEKQKEIDEVMDDGGRKTKHLDIADLMRLFGNIEEADDGRQFIVVDNPAQPGGFHADEDHEGYADEF